MYITMYIRIFTYNVSYILCIFLKVYTCILIQSIPISDPYSYGDLSRWLSRKTLLFFTKYKPDYGNGDRCPPIIRELYTGFKKQHKLKLIKFVFVNVHRSLMLYSFVSISDYHPLPSFR